MWCSNQVNKQNSMRQVCYRCINQLKSLLLSHHHSTSALVSEILKSVLQTVQKKKQFTYGQYIFTEYFLHGSTLHHRFRLCCCLSKILALFHGMVWYGLVRLTFGGFQLVTVPGTFFLLHLGRGSKRAVLYQNVMCV